MTELLEKEMQQQREMTPFHEELFPLLDRNFKSFLHFMQSLCRFHLGFGAALALEAALTVTLFSIDSHSLFLPLALSLFFFTLFAYVILNVYLQGKKGHKFLELLDTFILECQEFIPYDWEELEYHTSMSLALRKFAEKLSLPEKQQIYFLKLPLFSKDFFKMRELLLQTVVEEHIEMVKLDPQNVEVHASLANGYVLLALLYSEMPEKFKQVIAFAIEEFEIVKEYAPNDPWVYAQLAYGWKEIGLPEKEIESYETIVSLRPGDLDSLFYLGSLYFSCNHNAKGLQIYENLRKLDERKAMELIGYYGKERTAGG